MSDRLTVIIPPVLSHEEREQEALERCRGSLTAGNGWGVGLDDGYGNRRGDGHGVSWGDGDGWGDGWIWGYGSSDGNGRSKTDV